MNLFATAIKKIENCFLISLFFYLHSLFYFYLFWFFSFTIYSFMFILYLCTYILMWKCWIKTIKKETLNKIIQTLLPTSYGIIWILVVKILCIIVYIWIQYYFAFLQWNALIIINLETSSTLQMRHSECVNILYQGCNSVLNVRKIFIKCDVRHTFFLFFFYWQRNANFI